ncbi:MAG: ketoacyl-ACP synthase III [Polyangiaceae bacterium]|nr:ketoacyl-ACP synthase III [Myxococcales bacterium]MCB9584240.1 ketoacyl-ACP synthase III [Polyangiaceae bacterium]MCB9608597.1 ketoacyl-ACP synthase III [Polyangiaceae bacterium]
MSAEQLTPKSRIVGTGAYAPSKVLTNHDLEKIVDTSDAWIRERTGIGERRMAAEGEAASDMALEAAKRALDMAGVKAEELDMIIVGTISPDMPLPACAAFLQAKLGARSIPSFDVAAACAGFLYALSIGDQYIRTGMVKRVLVVGVELLTRVLNWEDRTTCVLFGDGAGAAVLAPAEGGPAGVLSTQLYTDASLAESLCIPAGGSKEPLTPELIEKRRDKVHMIGQDIFKVAVKNLSSASKSALEVAGLELDQVDWVVPHQANLRIINQVSQRLKIPMDRFVLNIERYGNTSSASIPIALDEAVRDGRIQPGQTVLMCALGAGISWASALARM